MTQVAYGPTVGSAWLRNTPLALCYVAFPLSNQVAEAIGTPLYRNWIDIAWLLLVGAVLALRPFGRATRGVPVSRLLATTTCVAAVAWSLIGVMSGLAPMVTAAMELKPVVYGLITIVLISRVAPPQPEAFCRYGAVLAALLVSEALVRSVAGAVVERPLGSGEVNYDAALLCIALVFAATDRRLARRYGWVIWAGVLASFSRTSLIAACLVLLFSAVVTLRVRMLMSGLAVIAVLASFAIRDLEVGNVESLDRYWMWTAGLEYLSSNPLIGALGTAPGSMVDVDVPKFIAELWTDQQEKLDLEGIYPFHFHAMWLRLAIAWGWLPVALAALVFYRHFYSNPRRAPEGRPFLVVCVVLGLTMGLLYLGNVAPVVLLAAYQVHTRQRIRLHSRKALSPVPPLTFATAPTLRINTGLGSTTDR
jgi:hypothetical protein